MIPYSRQDITEADIAEVVAVLKSDFLTQGPRGPAFEKRVAEYTGAAHAVAVSNATAALHIACMAVGLGPGDWLWTSPITFVASANCGLYCGASVDFVDVDPTTFNMCADRLAEKLEQADHAGRLPKVVIPVHLCGLPCDMAAIGALAERYGFHVIEDASHAIGARYQDRPIGSCAHSDVTVFSFHPVKIVTTGEGGVATTNDPALARRMARARTHGVTRAADEMVGASEGPWYYQQIELGYNYRMTELQAALGLTQMERLDDYVARRNELAARYDEAFADFPLAHQGRPSFAHSAFHLYVIRLDNAQRRRATFEALRAGGIGVNVHYIPVHLQPFYRERGFVAGDFPQAEWYYDGAISLPLFPTMTLEQQAQVIDAVRDVLVRLPETPRLRTFEESPREADENL